MDIHAEWIEAIDWMKAAGIRMLELSGKPEHEKAKVDFQKARLAYDDATERLLVAYDA